jgi:anti-sigma-K factor RskA
MTHDEVQALASEYVLGALDEVTRGRVAAHLSSCQACAADIRQVAQALDGIGRSVPDVAPPGSLRDRIAGIPARVPQIPAAAPTRAGAGPVPSPAIRTAPRSAPWFAAIAASLIAAVATWQAFGARAEIQRLRRELAQMQVMVGEGQVARASLQEQVDEFTRLAGVLRASDVVTYSLAGSGAAASAKARAYVTHKNGMAFYAEGLPSLPAGKVYQLWVIVGSTPVSAGTFSPDANGRVQTVVPTPDIAALPGIVAVTLEPAGGLPKPSTDPILVGTALPQ